MIVLMDVDGVMGDFVGGVLAAYERITGNAITLAHLQPVQTCDLFSHPILAPHKIELFQAIKEEGFCMGLQPIKGSVIGFQRLQAIASEIYIVTSPWYSSSYWVKERNEWLRNHYGIAARNVIYTSAKHMIRGDVFVDDRTENVSTWAIANRSNGLDQRRALLWNTLFNVMDPPPSGSGVYMQVVNGWDQLIQVVDGKPVLREGVLLWVLLVWCGVWGCCCGFCGASCKKSDVFVHREIYGKTTITH